MLKDGVSQELASLHHVHVPHILCQLGDGDIAVDGGDAVAVEGTTEAGLPLLLKTLPLVRVALWHGDQGRRCGVVVEEFLLKLRRILIRLDLIGQRLSSAQAALVGVQGV